MSGTENISPFDDHGKRPVPEDKLLAYLEGRLSPEEQREVELWLAEEGMESDALDGLNMVRPAETRHTIDRLNHRLRKELAGKKKRRRKPNTDHVTWVAIGIVLLLAIACYVVVKLRMAR